MNLTLTSLEALILKATHESLPCPDSAALEAFCVILRDSAEGPQLAAQALATRIHSSNSREALLALTMLDRCMRRCDGQFHSEIGKFRFLNELIKLVSPKYYADRTASDVQTRVLQLLHAWSIEYPKESKFKVAYDMLKNQGVVKETPPPLPPEDLPSVSRSRAKNAIFEDEEKSKLLQKLLQSKKPEDLQHANKLIKTMVREEERRNEASSRRAQEVSLALDSAGLLRDMVARASEASADEEQLIHELHASCSRLKPQLHALAASDLHADHLDDIIHASDVLDEVFEEYNAFVKKKERNVETAIERKVSNSDTLLDFARGNTDKVEESNTNVNSNKSNVIDELGDIFSSESASSNSIVEPLKPVNLMQCENIDRLEETNNKTEGWDQLDSLGEQLLKQSLPNNAKRPDAFNSKPLKKIPMNALEKSPQHEAQILNNGPILDLDYFTKKVEEPRKSSPLMQATTSTIQKDDDLMVDISSDTFLKASPEKVINNNALLKEHPVNNILDLGLPLENNIKCDTETSRNSNREIKSPKQEKEEQSKKQNEVQPLTEINVTLDSIKPSKVPPLTAFEEDGGVTVVLHFCRDKPRPDVNVIVISTTSKNTLPIEDYKFQGVVPKGCKIRLLTPSSTTLPAYNPFLPPPALTQVMLVGRPAARPVCLKFVITYTCDGETYSEMGEVDKLPLDDVKD